MVKRNTKLILYVEKDLARKAKEQDKILAINGEWHVIKEDIQAMNLSPQIPASTLY